MSKILRKTAKIFGSGAGSNQIAKFGSLAASAPVLYSGASADPDNIQSLANWLSGWFAGVEGASSPAIEDMNAFCYVMAYQIAYQMQQGIPEWNSTTTYYSGSVVSVGSSQNFYMSIVDTNLNNLVTDTSKWIPFGNILANTRTRAQGNSVGLGDVAVSNSCGAFVSTSTSAVDITNLTCTLVTSGNPVWVGLIYDGSLGNQCLWNINSDTGATATIISSQSFIMRDVSTTVGAYKLSLRVPSTSSNFLTEVPGTTIQTIDRTAAAGSHTYKVQALTSNAAFHFEIDYARLVAYELS